MLFHCILISLSFTSKQTDVEKSKKDLQKVTEKLCDARRISMSQIQKYLFPIQVNPVFQELGTPPSKDADIDISKGMCFKYASCCLEFLKNHNIEVLHVLFN